MKLADITRMTRSGDPKYPAVRAAYFGSLASGAVAMLYDLLVNENFSIIDSAAVAVAAFLGWAIARELDPDHPSTALVALGGAAFLAIWLLPYLLLSAVALGGLRLLVGSVGGGGPTRLDLVVMVVLSGYAGWRTGGWFLVVVIVIAILVSAGREGLFWAAAALFAAVIGEQIWEGTSPPTSDVVYAFVVVPVLLVIGFLLALPVAPSAKTDIGKQPLNPRRLRAARILGGLAIMVAVFMFDIYGIALLGPLTGAVVATGLLVPFWMLRQRESDQTAEVF